MSYLDLPIPYDAKRCYIKRVDENFNTGIVAEGLNPQTALKKAFDLSSRYQSREKIKPMFLVFSEKDDFCFASFLGAGYVGCEDDGENIIPITLFTLMSSGKDE